MFDPKQLDPLDLFWEKWAPVFDFLEVFKVEWESYTTMDCARANAVEDLCSWWARRLGPLHLMPMLHCGCLLFLQILIRFSVLLGFLIQLLFGRSCVAPKWRYILIVM